MCGHFIRPYMSETDYTMDIATVNQSYQSPMMEAVTYIPLEGDISTQLIYYLQSANSSSMYHNQTEFPTYIPGVKILGRIGTSLGCFACVLNIIFLHATFSIRHKDSTYNNLIQNLTVCDILGSITFVTTQNWPQGPFAHILDTPVDVGWWVQCLPYVFRSLPWMFFTAYMLTLNCLSVSQYLAACKPHIYISLRMRKYFHYVLVVVWLFSSLQIVFPAIVLVCLSSQPMQEAFTQLIHISKVEMVVWMLVYMLSTCVAIVFNTIVYFKLRQLKCVQSANQGSRTASGNTRIKNEAFITISCLCVASIFCRLPLPLVGMLLITIIERSYGHIVMSWTLATLVLLLYLVFVVDPVIYILRLPEVRQVLWDRLWSIVTCPNIMIGRGQKMAMKKVTTEDTATPDCTVGNSPPSLAAMSELIVRKTYYKS